jgi:FtsH-binding integral membrane protein
VKMGTVGCIIAGVVNSFGALDAVRAHEGIVSLIVSVVSAVAGFGLAVWFHRNGEDL